MKANILKPLAILLPILFIRKFFDPIYCDPQCAIRLVNESDPRAFSVHPYWKDLTYDDSCTPDLLQAYRNGQFSLFEGWLQTNMTMTWNILAIITLTYLIFNSLKNGIGVMNAIRISIGCFIVGFFAGTLLMMHTHFEQDITFLTGAIIHHAEESSPAMNLKKSTMSQGYLLCGFVNRFFYSYIIYSFITKSKKLSAAFNPLVIVSLLNLMVWYAVATVKHKHPWYHEVATPEMKYAMPYSQESRAYHHVILHHDTGESFSGDPFLDVVFDYQLYAFGFLHNKVFGIQLGSLAHHLFNTVFDCASGLICNIIIFGLLHACAMFMPAENSKTKSN
jgi:hypothetical protein